MSDGFERTCSTCGAWFKSDEELALHRASLAATPLLAFLPALATKEPAK